MDPATQSDRILLTRDAEAKNQRFAVLPLGARQWEIRDIVEGKPQTCLNCRYWSMWDHSCATRAAALDDFSPVNPDTPACKEFQPE